jgi:hypothetical protein
MMSQLAHHRAGRSLRTLQHVRNDLQAWLLFNGDVRHCSRNIGDIIWDISSHFMTISRSSQWEDKILQMTRKHRGVGQPATTSAPVSEKQSHKKEKGQAQEWSARATYTGRGVGAHDTCSRMLFLWSRCDRSLTPSSHYGVELKNWPNFWERKLW